MSHHDSNKWVICLGAGESQLPLILESQKLGYHVLAIDRNFDVRGREIANDFINVSTHDTAGVMNELDRRNYDWKSVLHRATGNALFTAAKISEILELPGPDIELAQICTSKSKLRENSIKYGFRMPKGFRVEGGDQSFLTTLKKPVIVKPDSTLIGKKDICVCKSKPEIRKAISAAISSSANGFAEVEEFINGSDCSYLAWLDRGKVTIFFSWNELINIGDNGKIQSVGAFMPSSIESDGYGYKIENHIRNFAAQFPKISTLLAFSFRVDENNNPWLIEIHGDLTGDLILDVLAPEATGTNVIALVVERIITGFSISLSDQDIKPTGLLYSNDTPHLISSNKVSDLLSLLKKRRISHFSESRC